MDDRLEKALEFSNFRLILITRQKSLKTLLHNKLLLNYNSGLFRIDMTLISYINSLIEGKQKECIVLDINDIPIKIENLSDFKDKINENYQKSLNQYYKQYEKLMEAREIRKVIDWDEIPTN